MLESAPSADWFMGLGTFRGGYKEGVQILWRVEIRNWDHDHILTDVDFCSIFRKRFTSKVKNRFDLSFKSPQY